MSEAAHLQQGSDQLNSRLRNAIACIIPELRPSERKVARFLLSEGEKHTDFSLRSLAMESGTSEATVVRLCKRLGLPGFREFRLLWVQETVRKRKESSQRPPLFSDLFERLVKTSELLQPVLENAASIISKSNQLFVYGGGGSGLVAELAAESFSLAGRMAVAFHSGERAAASVPYIDKETSVLIVSHRGVNPSLERVCVEARRRSAAVIVITSRADSNLALLADVLLLTVSTNDLEGHHGVAVARAVQVSVIHVLVESLRRQLDPL